MENENINTQTLENMLDKMNVELTEENDNTIQKETQPKYGSQEWSDWLMSKLTEKEFYSKEDKNTKEKRKYPTTDGLRRLCSEYFGEIIYSCPHTVQCPNYGESGKIVPTLVEHKMSVRSYETGHIITMGDVAEVWHLNTTATYCAFPGSTAATKALGRTLRKILGLYGVLTIEEIGDVDTSAPELNGNKINNSQINFINVMCKQNDIDVIKFINSGKNKYNNITDINSETADKMLEKLSLYNNGDKDKIPEKIRGYNQDWRQQYDY